MADREMEIFDGLAWIARQERVVRASDQGAAAGGVVYPQVTHGNPSLIVSETARRVPGGPEAALEVPTSGLML
jgi:hypothetical protein